MKLFFKLIVVFFVSVLVFPIYGQESNTSQKSVIIISESEISTLINTLKKYKKLKNETVFIEKEKNEANIVESTFEVDFLRHQLALLEQDINTKTIAVQPIKKVEPVSSSKEDELQIIKLELAELKGKLSQINNLGNQQTKPTIITLPSQEKTYFTTKPVPSVKIPSNDSIFIAKKVDSLSTILSSLNTKKDTSYAKNLVVLQKRLHEIKNQLSTIKPVIKSGDNLKTYKQQFLFDNNATAISKNQAAIIDELALIVTLNSNIDLYLKGFASNKGNITVNERISLERTEAVKKALIFKGVHPTRILTQYHGIDYQAATEAEARRVDIELLIRN